MTDLEKTIDSTKNTEATTASDIGDDFSLDFSDSLSQEAPQVEPDLSEDSSPTENILSPDLNGDAPSPDLSENTPSPNLSEEISPSNITEDIPSVVNEDTSSKLTENISSPDLGENTQTNNFTDNEISAPDFSAQNTQPDLTNYQQVNNNEASFWEINNEWNNTTDKEETNDTPINSVDSPLEQPTLQEQPSINENPLAENPLAENPLAEKITNADNQDQEKNKISPKEKLAQLVKLHESKAQKNWFIKWILSGVALTIVIALAWFIFAKDQILDLINKMNGNNQQLTANIVDITNSTNEEIISEDENINDEEQIKDEENIIDDEDLYLEDFIDEEFTDEDFYNDEIIFDEEDNYLDEEIIPEDEEIQIVSEDEQSYTITHVESEEDANWVLPSHCSDLRCYGEDKEFTPCTTFRLSENLDGNANRIGNNWTCRYKDTSELVYVEFN